MLGKTECEVWGGKAWNPGGNAKNRDVNVGNRDRNAGIELEKTE